jgi:hypothetical protein
LGEQIDGLFDEEVVFLLEFAGEETGMHSHYTIGVLL